jgi:tRNA(Ile)-lysidine synthase
VLLAEAARAAGAAVLLLGHTADDVREGERMRARGSTLGRLRDWAPSPVWPEGREVFLCRPLLDMRRAELRARLSALGLDWIEDPANADPRFLRARVRAELETAPDCHPGSREAAIRDRRDEAASPWRSRLGACPRAGLRPDPGGPACAGGSAGMTREYGSGGLLAFPRNAFRGQDVRAELAVALVCASGRERPPRGAALDRLATRLATEDSFTATLAGARAEAGPEIVRIFREPGETARGGLAPIRLEPGRPSIWDGRFEVTAGEPGTVRAAGGLLGRLDGQDRTALRALPPAARAGVPVLIRDSQSRPVLAGRSARVRDLVELRRLTACGLIAHEREITGLRVALAV